MAMRRGTVTVSTGVCVPKTWSHSGRVTPWLRIGSAKWWWKWLRRTHAP